MIDETRILKVQMDGNDGLLVTFSDGTTAGYVVEELLDLRPYRETVEESLKSDRPNVSRGDHGHHMQRGRRAHGPAIVRHAVKAKPLRGAPQP